MIINDYRYEGKRFFMNTRDYASELRELS